MLSTALAAALREAGLRWTPISGDAFQIGGAEFEGDVYWVSEMTVEPQLHPTGTVLGFNGTTEWALDAVALDDALWLPREDQLRDLLGSAFVSLARDPGGDGGRVGYAVTVRVAGEERRIVRDDPAEAYGVALLSLLEELGSGSAAEAGAA